MLALPTVSVAAAAGIEPMIDTASRTGSHRLFMFVKAASLLET
jgi:hypothetical protein